MIRLRFISHFTPELLAELVDLYQRAYEDEPLYAYRERKRIKSYLKWLLKHARGGFLVAFEGEKAVGFLALEETEPVPEIHELVVEPSYRGRNLAEKLMRRALEYLQARGHRRVALWVGEHNRRAQKFYQKLGFEPTGKAGIWIRMERDLQEREMASSQRTRKASSTSSTEMVSSGV